MATDNMVRTCECCSKCHMTKGLHGDLLDFVLENFDFKIMDPKWLSFKYNSIFTLHKFSMVS